MRRIPLTLRALVLVPLLAVLADQARATLACGPQAQTCLEAAGRGWLGGAGIALLLLYAVGLALLVGRLARGRTAAEPAPSWRLWLLGSAGVAAVCGGQAFLAGDPAALGGGWLELLAFSAAAGGVIALALRAVPAAAALMRDLRPAAPRPRPGLALAAAFPLLSAGFAGAPRSPATAGRAPPRS